MTSMKADPFRDQSVLITGGASGFGRTIAGAFQMRGANVYICDIDPEGLTETVNLIGESCWGTRVDVTDRDRVYSWIEMVLKLTGRIDVLVNNAGGVLGQVGRALEDVDGPDWESIVAVNQTAAFWTSQAVAPTMKAAGRGRIINISSGAGLGVSKTGIQAYAAAKAGVIGLTRQLAHELGPFGITVNSIAPGFVLSNESTRRQWDALGHDGQHALLDGIALRRLGTPADIAHAVLFLASEQAEWISGVVLPVDGGK
ncbi:MAG: glucose 1-dehydrogenase [Gemmatimonadota bacterium]